MVRVLRAHSIWSPISLDLSCKLHAIVCLRTHSSRPAMWRYQGKTLCRWFYRCRPNGNPTSSRRWGQCRAIMLWQRHRRMSVGKPLAIMSSCCGRPRTWLLVCVRIDRPWQEQQRVDHSWPMKRARVSPCRLVAAWWTMRRRLNGCRPFESICSSPRFSTWLLARLRTDRPWPLKQARSVPAMEIVCGGHANLSRMSFLQLRKRPQPKTVGRATAQQHYSACL